MRKQATIRARGRLRCRWKYGGCWECEPETDSYSKAMEKRCGCGRLETRTRFQNIAVLVTQIFRLAERVSESGCVGRGVNDYCRRHNRGHRAVGQRPNPELGRTKRFGCSFWSREPCCRCSRVRGTKRSPRAQRKTRRFFFRGNRN